MAGWVSLIRLNTLQVSASTNGVDRHHTLTWPWWNLCSLFVHLQVVPGFPAPVSYSGVSFAITSFPSFFCSCLSALSCYCVTQYFAKLKWNAIQPHGMFSHTNCLKSSFLFWNWCWIIASCNLCNTHLSYVKQIFRIVVYPQEGSHWHGFCTMVLCILALVICLLLEQEWSNTFCQQLSFLGFKKS